MYEAACSSPLPAPAGQQQQQQPLESEEISLFLQNLLHSSSSSSSSSSARQKQMSFSASGLYSSSSSSAQFGNLPMMENNQHRLLQSVRVSESEFRVRDGTSTSTDDESSAGLIGSGSGVYCPPQGMKEAAGIMSSVGVRDCDAVAVSIRRRKQQHQAVENDLDEFDCDSEEGVEASEEPPKTASTRSSSKRSRAAEVHNLSEKRRRSRINEKMKALQNLIPNSNKTDKASMLDEAIEYLKQLQLQVQMLSMRNGLSLHPMYLPGVLQPPQLPQVRMGFSKGNGLPPHMNAGSVTRPMNQECSLQTSFGPSNQCTTSRQPMVISSMANNSHSETSYGLDSPNRVHQGPFPLSSAAEDIFKEDVLSQQQLHVNQSARNPSENKMKPMAASSVTFDARGSILENSNSVEECLLRADRSPDMFSKDLDDNQSFVQHLHRSTCEP